MCFKYRKHGEQCATIISRAHKTRWFRKATTEKEYLYKGMIRCGGKGEEVDEEEERV